MKRIAIVLAVLLAAGAANAEFKKMPRRSQAQSVPPEEKKADVIVLPGHETPPPLVLPTPSRGSDSGTAPLIQFTVPPVAAPAQTPAAPAPAAEPKPPVAVTAPVTVPSAPIAAPLTPATPHPAAAAAPSAPPKMATPIPPAPPPVVARPATIAEPAAASQPPQVASPAPAAAPAAAAPAPAAATPPAALSAVAMARPAPPPKPSAPDAKLIERIFACLSPGLPQDWDKTWIVVTDLGAAPGKERQFEAQFFFTTLSGDEKGEPLTPCNSKGLALQVHDMNDMLAPEKRNWRKAQLLITSEGRFELKYDYPQ